MKRYVELLVVFFKIGLFTFGGGYAMIPLIEREIVEKRKWIGPRELTDMLAVSQSIPGGVAINAATMIGCRVKGKKGGVAATCGVVLPSYCVILLVALFFEKLNRNPVVKAAFSGIRPAVAALIALSAIRIGRSSIVDRIGLLSAALAAFLVVALNVQAIYVILGGAALGILIYLLWPAKTRFIAKQNRRSR